MPPKPQQSTSWAPGRLVWSPLWEAFKLWYGLTATIILGILAFTTKKKFLKLSPADRKLLAETQDRFWNLSRKPDGINHDILTLKSGFKIHYVYTIPKSGIRKDTGLVIFFHGFPDSWLLWRHFLSLAKLNDNVILVAVDLPGYGGSDSLQKYTPTEALNNLAEFVLAMRSNYSSLDDVSNRKGKTLIVAHDWGAAIAYRMAAEAPQLADRFILAGAVHLPHIVEGIKNKTNTAKQILHTWTQKPSQYQLLYKAASAFYPVLLQLYKSYYIFVFNTPKILSSRITIVGDFWVYRFLNAFTFGEGPSEPIPGDIGMELFASSLGPSEQECNIMAKKSGDGRAAIAYGESVRRRVPNGGWYEKISIYRDGMFTQPWDKSLEIMWELSQLEQSKQQRRRSSGTIFDDGPDGSLKAPITVIWGKHDVAMTYRMATEGLGDFFGCKGSQVVMLPNVGHWSPMSKEAQPVYEEAILWSLQGEGGTLKARFEDKLPAAIVQYEK